MIVTTGIQPDDRRWKKNICRVFINEINAKTSDLNPSVMCTSKSEKGYSLCFLFVQKQNQSHSQALKLVIARSWSLLQWHVFVYLVLVSFISDFIRRRMYKNKMKYLRLIEYISFMLLKEKRRWKYETWIWSCWEKMFVDATWWEAKKLRIFFYIL
jgi:hypothetical protein